MREVAVTITMTSREFNQNTSAVKRVAMEQGEVIITDRGEPSLVVITFERWQKLQRLQPSLVDMLAMEEVEDIDFDPPKLGDGLFRAADL